MRPTTEPLVRFMRKVNKTNTCWLWTAATTTDGYGRFHTGGAASRRVVAHRWLYETLIGPVPDGLDLDHECHNRDAVCPGGRECLHRLCVNPAHLAPSTRSNNLLRGYHRSGGVAA